MRKHYGRCFCEKKLANRSGQCTAVRLWFASSRAAGQKQHSADWFGSQLLMNCGNAILVFMLQLGWRPEQHTGRPIEQAAEKTAGGGRLLRHRCWFKVVCKPLFRGNKPAPVPGRDNHWAASRHWHV